MNNPLNNKIYICCTRVSIQSGDEVKFVTFNSKTADDWLEENPECNSVVIPNEIKP